MRSRRISWKPLSTPLWTISQFLWRNGWQLVSWIDVPEVARTWARNSCDSTWAASSRRLRSPHAGATLWYIPGPSPAPYQPIPNPSPFVVSAPMRECRLWSTSPCWVLNSSSSNSSGCPDQAIQRHMMRLLVRLVAGAGLHALAVQLMQAALDGQRRARVGDVVGERGDEG